MEDYILENSLLWENGRLHFRKVPDYGNIGDYILEKSQNIRIWETIF